MNCAFFVAINIQHHLIIVFHQNKASLSVEQLLHQPHPSSNAATTVGPELVLTTHHQLDSGFIGTCHSASARQTQP